MALGLGGAVAAQLNLEARRGVAALRTEGEPALPTGVLMIELDDSTWRRSATGGERQWRVGRGGRQRGAALTKLRRGELNDGSALTRRRHGRDGRARGEGSVGSTAASSDSAVGAARLGPRGRKRLNGTTRARARGSHAETAR
jgi:hypothetical protein